MANRVATRTPDLSPAEFFYGVIENHMFINRKSTKDARPN